MLLVVIVEPLAAERGERACGAPHVVDDDLDPRRDPHLRRRQRIGLRQVLERDAGAVELEHVELRRWLEPGRAERVEHRAGLRLRRARRGDLEAVSYTHLTL